MVDLLGGYALLSRVLRVYSGSGTFLVDKIVDRLSD